MLPMTFCGWCEHTGTHRDQSAGTGPGSVWCRDCRECISEHGSVGPHVRPVAIARTLAAPLRLLLR